MNRKMMVAASVITAGALLGAAFALPAITVPANVPGSTGGGDHNVGRHAFKVNIIGRPNDWNGQDTGSNSKVLFIGLRTNSQDVVCESASGVIDDAGQTSDMIPTGRQTIFFTGTTDGTFDVLDRDATDGSARIAIPANVDGYDMYVRVLGKPGGCLDADAFAANITDTGTTYFFAGHLDANRRTGTPQKIRVDALFYVWIDTDADGTVDTQVSVFDSFFQDYFWQVSNNGLRNMQLIFVTAA